MNVWLGRFAAWLAALGAGAALGALGGAVTGSTGWGSAFGALAAALIVGAVEAVRAAKLLAWLRGAQVDAAPRDKGFWGELGYRIEKALRRREQEAAAERERLHQFLRAIDASPNGVMLLDAHDRIEWCNARAADHFALDPERDREQIVTNLLRTPAFVAYLEAGAFEAPIDIPGPRARTEPRTTRRASSRPADRQPR